MTRIRELKLMLKGLIAEADSQLKGYNTSNAYIFTLAEIVKIYAELIKLENVKP